MGVNRKNTVVVDLSRLPKRPEPGIVEKFMYEELKLDLEDTTNIQFHNVRNVVYVEMVDAPTAMRYHSEHHLRRVLKIDRKEFKIPVYVDDGAVNVRVHDLPPGTSNAVLKEHMQQFGTILSICRETWKNYFPGVFNGVRVVRMEITKPIPSYQTIDGETTLITYPNQPKTCRFCGLKSHPGQKCGTPGKNATTNRATNDNANSASFAAMDFPPLGGSQQKPQKQKQQERITEQSQARDNNNSDADEQTDDSDSNSDELLTNNKRRLSTTPDGNEQNEMKRKNIKSNSTQNDESEQPDLQSQDYSEEVGNMATQMNGNERESTDTVSPVSPAVTRSQKKKKQQLQNV